MNFDTRTIIDIINLNNELKETLFDIILNEQMAIGDADEFNNKILMQSVTPILKNKLKEFLFIKELNKMDLSILKGIVDLKNVDYDFLIKEITA